MGAKQSLPKHVTAKEVHKGKGQRFDRLLWVVAVPPKAHRCYLLL